MSRWREQRRWHRLDRDGAAGRLFRRQRDLPPLAITATCSRASSRSAAWLRVAGAGAAFALWRRPWHALRGRLVVALGVVPCRHERLLLPRDRPASARNRRRSSSSHRPRRDGHPDTRNFLALLLAVVAAYALVDVWWRASRRAWPSPSRTPSSSRPTSSSRTASRAPAQSTASQPRCSSRPSR